MSPDKLYSDDQPPVLGLGERLHTVVGKVGQRQVCQNLVEVIKVKRDEITGKPASP